MKFSSVMLMLVAVLAACTTKQRAFVQHAEVQLSTPSVRAEDVFFRKETTIHIGEYPSGVSLYVINQESAEKETQLVTAKALKISESAKLRFQAKGLNFKPSEMSKVQLYKVDDRPVEISYLTPRSEPYDRAEPSVLFDHKKAEKKFGDTGWLGFKQNSVQVDLVLDGTELNGVVLSFLEDQKSWIFGASAMRVEAFDLNDTLLHVGEVSYSGASQKEGAGFQFLETAFEPIMPSRLRLTVYPLLEIPRWHPGSGTVPWLFIDEIVLL